MKIHILFKIHEGAWGGGNQFLKILRLKLLERKLYEESILKTDSVIVNSYHELAKAVYLKWKYPQKKIFHRLGPLFSLHRKSYWKLVDRIVLFCAKKIADKIIFQSEWSLQKAVQMEGSLLMPYTIIHNAADDRYFNRKYKKDVASSKTQLIATSWSKNYNKGFKFLKYLDDHLDFSRYAMVFIGNSPVKFNTIQQLAPLSPSEIADQLKRHDIFISGIKDDACSNSIIEALSCGLPVIAFNSGANEELIKKGGELFKDNLELLRKIDQVRSNYDFYKSQITVKTMDEVVEAYVRAIQDTSSSRHISFGAMVLLYSLIKVTFGSVRMLDKILSN